MAEQLLFDRRCRVTIATPVSTPGDFTRTTTDVMQIEGGRTDDGAVGLRVAFKIDKNLDKQPNTSTITISNLSPTTRASIQRKGVKVLLEAGYKETGLTRLFSGDVRIAEPVRNGATWDVNLKLGDGERAWQFAEVNESYAPGTRVADALRSVAKAMGLKLGNVDQQLSEIAGVFDSGWAATGRAAKALDKIVTSIGKEWSIQDGEIQILDPYQALEHSVPEVSPETGLVGSPEMGSPPTKGKPQLLQFTTLLLPVKPGGKVRLRSARYDGLVRVHKVSHEGDTHGGPWYSKIDASIIRR